MNQILQIRKNSKKKLTFFKLQIIFSIIGIFSVIGYFKSSQNYNLSNENYSKFLSLGAEINSIYTAEKLSYSNILGKIEIPKIGIEYSVFNEFNEDLLKISPCKFYGVNINETGNIAIAGHNYDNHTFFSDINKLENEDEIYLYSNENKKYRYLVYSCYETTSDDLSCLKNSFLGSKELTLITCNNSNKKRFVVKAIYQN